MPHTLNHALCAGGGSARTVGYSAYRTTSCTQGVVEGAEHIMDGLKGGSKGVGGGERAGVPSCRRGSCLSYERCSEHNQSRDLWCITTHASRTCAA